ncbi:MAG: rhomboid family intramembrane serine protease [Candidatus Aenigmarchaeota archaeon]|nr:rhomboid family intramembrane serine protease [Candidatus Aenigmarchaeota archaeon]
MEEKWPIVTLILITINLAVFLFTYDISSNKVSDEVVDAFGLTPQFLVFRPYTLITHMFLHADIIHFMGNMLMLSIVGLVCEDKIGSLKFLLFYLLSGFCTIPFGFIMEIFTNTLVILIGASGAVYGVMFLAAMIAGWEEVPAILIPILNIIAAPIIFFSLKNIKVPLFVAILFYFLLNLVMMLYNLPYSIGELAHFGGVTGGIIGVLLILPEQFK